MEKQTAQAKEVYTDYVFNIQWTVVWEFIYLILIESFGSRVYLLVVQLSHRREAALQGEWYP